MAKSFQTILCEKPSQAADWAKFLQFSPSHKKKNHYVDPTRGIAIIHGIGHLFELAPPESYVPELQKQWSLSSLPVFPPKFKVLLKPDLKSVFDVICNVLSKTDVLLIATDADNEGELIARDIIEHAGFKGVVKRVLYSATDKKSLQKAFENPVDESKTRFMAQEANLRRRIDWLVGMNCTMALTTILRSSGQLSKGAFPVGRVITSVAMIVYLNELARRSFVERQFYTVKAVCRTASGSEFVATLNIPERYLDTDLGQCVSQKYANAFAEALRGKDLSVAGVDSVEKKVAPPLPHDLSSLQSAVDRFGIDADEALAIMQTLYDQPVSGVTYPRTECRYLPESMLDESKMIVKHLNDIKEVKRLDFDMSKKPAAFNDKKVEVHHGIIPTMQSVNLARLTDKQLCVYLIIVLRYVSQFMADYRYNSQKVTLVAGELSLLARGKNVITEGWRVAESLMKSKGDSPQVEESASEDDEDSGNVISVTKGEVVKVVKVEVVTGKTKKPSAFTTAKLIDEMKRPGRWCTVPELAKMLNDGDGLGTPATQSDVIKRALAKGLIMKSGRYLAPTKLFEAQAPRFSKMDAGFTAVMQRDIKAISSGVSDAEIITKYQTYISRVINEWRNTNTKV